MLTNCGILKDFTPFTAWTPQKYLVDKKLLDTSFKNKCMTFLFSRLPMAYGHRNLNRFRLHHFHKIYLIIIDDKSKIKKCNFS